MSGWICWTPFFTWLEMKTQKGHRTRWAHPKLNAQVFQKKLKRRKPSLGNIHPSFTHRSWALSFFESEKFSDVIQSFVWQAVDWCLNTILKVLINMSHCAAFSLSRSVFWAAARVLRFVGIREFISAPQMSFHFWRINKENFLSNSLLVLY